MRCRECREKVPKDYGMHTAAGPLCEECRLGYVAIEDERREVEGLPTTNAGNLMVKLLARLNDRRVTLRADIGMANESETLLRKEIAQWEAMNLPRPAPASSKLSA